MPRLTFAGSTDIGRRTSQQDDYLLQSAVLPNHPDSYLFAVFDGHGTDGAKVATFAKQMFPTVLSELVDRIKHDPVGAMRDAYATVNERLTDNQAIDTYMSGSTAALVLIVEGKLVVSHIGDSRVLLGRRDGNGGFRIEQLTKDHTCDDPTELARVTGAGARVDRLQIGDTLDASAPLRIFKGTLPYPGLVVTRALGDTVASRLGILSSPDVKVIELTPSEAFLVLGTDGVWDGVSVDEVLEIVSKQTDPVAVSKRLTECSLIGMDRQHLDDNTTNIVVYIQWL